MSSFNEIILEDESLCWKWLELLIQKNLKIREGRELQDLQIWDIEGTFVDLDQDRSIAFDVSCTIDWIIAKVNQLYSIWNI